MILISMTEVTSKLEVSDAKPTGGRILRESGREATASNGELTPAIRNNEGSFRMTHTIDTSHTLIEFSVKHMMVSTVKGRFTKFSGDVEIDEANPANSKVDVVIDAASISTGDEKRDGHLR